MKKCSVNKIIVALISVSVILFSCKSKSGISGSDGNKKKQLTGYDIRKFEYAYFDGISARMKGNYQEALNKFKTCLDIMPENAAVYYEVAQIYFKGSRYNEALPFAKKAVEFDEENNWYLNLLADCYRELGQLNQAISAYQKAINNFPDKIDLYYDLASTYLHAGKPFDAVKVYDKIEEKIGITEQISLQKQRIYSKQKQYEKAANEIQKLIDANPANGEYYNILGQIYRQSGNQEKALAAYHKILQLDPSNGPVYLSMADYYRDQKDYARAFVELKKAFNSPSVDVDTKMQILLQYFDYIDTDQNLKTEADTLALIMVRTHPNEAKSFSIYGDVLYRDKKLTEARNAFRKAAELDKSRYPIWHQILSIDNDLNDNDALINEAATAIELFPNEPAPYLFKSIGLIQLKKFDDAITILNEGKNYVIDNIDLKAQFLSLLGDAYHQTKKYSESDNAFDLALELNPEDVNTLNNYAYYLSVRKEKLEKAATMSKKTVDKSPSSPSYLDTYGWILYQQEKYEEAKRWIQKALDNGAANSATILEHMGDVLYKLGDKSMALDYWNKAKNAGGKSEILIKKIAEKKLYE
jgi:tetratricopeptide (TPR) repeat protein